jgi:hypothetical protein
MRRKKHNAKRKVNVKHYTIKPPAQDIYHELEKIRLFFERVPPGLAWDEVAAMFIMGITGLVCRENSHKAIKILDNAKSKYLRSCSDYKEIKEKEKLEKNKMDYMLHDDGTPCYYPNKEFRMSDEDMKKYLDWSPTEMQRVNELAEMSNVTLQVLQTLFEQQAQQAFEIHYDATYMQCENMPRAPFQIYCKSRELMDSLRRLAFQIAAATDMINNSSK